MQSRENESHEITESELDDISTWLLRDIKEKEALMAAGKKINTHEYEEDIRALEDKLTQLARVMIISMKDLDNVHAALPLFGKFEDELNRKIVEEWKEDKKQDKNKIRE